MADFRCYAGVDFTSQFLGHYGVGHLQGGHSGRYEWGSGERSMQDSPLNKGSATKPYRYVPSKSIEKQIHYYAKKLKEGKITVQTIHTAKADVTQAMQGYLSFIGYGNDKDKEKLNREEKDQQALVVKADNHENRPHSRTQKIVEGTAEVKVKDAENNQQHLPAWMNLFNYQYSVPDGPGDLYLPTIDGTTNEGYRPDATPLYMTQEQYEALTNPQDSTFLSYYGKEKEKLDKVLNSPVTKLIIGMAKVADKVVNTLKKLKNVVVSAFKHSDDGFYLIEQGNVVSGYIGVDPSSKFLQHYGVGHDKGGHSGRYPWGSSNNVKSGTSSSFKDANNKKYTSEKQIKEEANRYAKENNLLPASDYRHLTERDKNASDLGLKALAKVWPDVVDEKSLSNKDYLDDMTFDFLFEDYTDGMPEIADFALQGKNVKEIKRLIIEADRIDRVHTKYDVEYDDDTVPIWALANCAFYLDKGSDYDKYIETCVNMASDRNKNKK